MKSISQALVKFQSQLKPVEKNAENPFFKSSYADLSSILAAVMPILSANGLAVMQPMKVQDGFTILKTVLVHESGESLESEMILPPHMKRSNFVQSVCRFFQDLRKLYLPAFTVTVI